jgi:uncharacterized protein (DUF302 family)
MSQVIGSKEGNGVVSIRSQYPFADTLQRLERAISAKGLKIFCVVDHSGEALAEGLHMPSTKLVIFGSPRAGTPLMLSAPSIALDLPQKILVGEDPGKQTWISYNSPSYLARRHQVSIEFTQALAAVEQIATAAAS